MVRGARAGGRVRGSDARRGWRHAGRPHARHPRWIGRPQGMAGARSVRNPAGHPPAPQPARSPGGFSHIPGHGSSPRSPRIAPAHMGILCRFRTFRGAGLVSVDPKGSPWYGAAFKRWCGAAFKRYGTVRHLSGTTVRHPHAVRYVRHSSGTVLCGIQAIRCGTQTLGIPPFLIMHRTVPRCGIFRGTPADLRCVITAMTSMGILQRALSGLRTVPWYGFTKGALLG